MFCTSMRLKESEKNDILNAVQTCISKDAVVWLFGSRCDDFMKGGDIDLFIDSPALEDGLKAKIKLKLKLEDMLGEQKIDIALHQEGTPYLPIHELALKNGIRLDADNL